MAVIQAGCVVIPASKAAVIVVLARRGLEDLRRVDGVRDPRLAQTVEEFAADAVAAKQLAGPAPVSEAGRPISAMAVDVLTVSDLVARTGKTDRTVRRWCAEGRWPSARQLAGGQWLVNAEDLVVDE